MTNKITLEEVFDLFGGEIPMEAMMILHNVSPDTTVEEVRAKLTTLSRDRATRNDKRERVAHAMWRQQALRASPNTARYRTRLAFADGSSQLRAEWLGYADAAIAAMTDPPEDKP